MTGIVSDDLIQHRDGPLKIPQNGEKRTFGGHDVVDDSSALIGAVGEAEAIFIEFQRLFEVVGLELFGRLSEPTCTLSSFCLSTLIEFSILNYMIGTINHHSKQQTAEEVVESLEITRVDCYSLEILVVYRFQLLYQGLLTPSLSGV